MDTTEVVTNSGPAIHFINVEYFLRLLYEFIQGLLGTQVGGVSGLGGLLVLASRVWIVVVVLSIIFSLFCIWVLVFYTLRYWQVKAEDQKRYETVAEPVAHAQLEHARWTYIRQLIESPLENEWRQAIIEADIMLDEMLTRQGHTGASLGEKLQQAKFNTLQNAWDAHKVRNDIAHQGSTYQLSPNIAYRTIALYETVFKEFGEI